MNKRPIHSVYEQQEIDQGEKLLHDSLQILREKYPDLTVRAIPAHTNIWLDDFHDHNIYPGSENIYEIKDEHFQSGSSKSILKLTPGGFKPSMHDGLNGESFNDTLYFEKGVCDFFPQVYVDRDGQIDPKPGTVTLFIKSESGKFSKTGNVLVNAHKEFPTFPQTFWKEILENEKTKILNINYGNTEVVRYPAGSNNFFAVVKITNDQQQWLLDHFNDGAKISWFFLPFDRIWEKIQRGEQILSAESEMCVKQFVNGEDASLKIVTPSPQQLKKISALKTYYMNRDMVSDKCRNETEAYEKRQRLGLGISSGSTSSPPENYESRDKFGFTTQGSSSGLSDYEYTLKHGYFPKGPGPSNLNRPYYDDD